MSLQFSRSMRSLRADSFRITRLGLLFGILLMCGLLVWFFFARVTLYENSTSIQIRKDGQAVARFSEEGLRRIRQGQPVVVRVDQGADLPVITIPGMVYDTQKQDGQVILSLFATDLPESLLAGDLSGRAEVEVEYITPVQLLVRAMGRYLDSTNQIPVSPQTFPTPTPRGNN